jgi:putative membrane protein
MMMGYGFGGGFGMMIGMITHLAFAAMIIMAAIWMYKTAVRGGKEAQIQTGALEILKQRYAKGEITTEEYQTMKKELE